VKEQNRILASVACNLDQQLLQATLPLFIQEEVEAIEWSFDTLYKVRNIPDWFVELLTAFGKEGRLIGHGVFFSLFSGKWSSEQEQWLHHLKKVSGNFTFDHITEHFGFMTGEDFHKGAPIGIPYNASTLALGIDRLKRIQDTCQCPVGLENLAFSYSLEEVKRHGEFLEALIEPINGFIILDLHNLYCQLHNFSLDAAELLPLYPLHRVREIHISGGSWEQTRLEPQRTIRRDTHDDAVPDAVFELLQLIIPRCPNLKFVVLEQLGTALDTSQQKQQFQADFTRMKSIVSTFNPVGSINNFRPESPLILNPEVAEDSLLASQQQELSAILENATDYENAVALLRQSGLAHSDWNVEEWSPYMLETAMRIAQKWKYGW
jgi:uncharacterized protein (UPF0276 family)